VSVCVFDMPWSSLRSPSIQLGIIKSILKRAGMSCVDEYTNIRWHQYSAKVVNYSSDVYRDISESRSGIGEFIFSVSNGGKFPSTDWFLEDEKRMRGLNEEIITISRELSEVADHFLEQEAIRVIDMGCTVFGFTTTFSQTVPSLALARKIKLLSPASKIIFGGANCAGEMGEALGELYQWIDIIFQGEAEGRIEDVFRCLLEGKTVDHLPGLILPPKRKKTSEEPPALGMEHHPVPDYDGYFREIQEVDQARGDTIQLIYETSRGCWWGERNHCGFCGLNADSMAFRSKPPRKVLEEIQELSERYGLNQFQIVDNILDKKYFKHLLPDLAKENFVFFWEVKASHKKEEVKLMAEAGIREIQPGIESLHEVTLRNMEKGVTPVVNIRFLRWCELYGVTPTWLIMHNLPGDHPDFYSRQAKLIPKLYHLEPPAYVKLELQRFSPYWQNPELYNIEIKGAYESYRLLHRGTSNQMEKICYEFEYGISRPTDLKQASEELNEAISKWQEVRRAYKPILNGVRRTDGGMDIVDSRSGITQKYSLCPARSELLNKCDSGMSIANLTKTNSSLDDIQYLKKINILEEIDNKLISLPVF
jgi:ribosomal peptide maturation radical SAM protein 1